MLERVLVAVLLVAGTVGIHAVGTTIWLHFLLRAVFRVKEHLQFGYGMFLTGATALFLLSLHACEVVLWATTYTILPNLEGPKTFSDALYFSFITFTTLGYGDVTILGRWRMLSGVEAMNGILLFGWSTAMLYALIHHLWQIGHSDRKERKR